jgi:terminase large subunit-like protein
LARITAPCQMITDQCPIVGIGRRAPLNPDRFNHGPPGSLPKREKRDDASEDWVFAARDAQLPPPDLSCWLFLGGRGAGKSHSMSAAVHTAVRAGAGIKRIHFIAPTTTDFHDVNVEGKSGIFATCGRDPRPRWVSSRRRLEWPNGAMCVFFSGEEPESLRGPEAEMVIVDEIARMRYQQSVFDTMMLGLRLGDRPRVLIAATPRTTPFMKKLVAMDKHQDHQRQHLRQCRAFGPGLPAQGARVVRRQPARSPRATRRDDPRPHERAI